MLSLYIYAIYSSFKSSVCVSAPDPTQHLKMRWLERFWRRTAIIFGSPTSEPGIINRYFSQSTFVTLCRICCATCVTAECCATCVAAECVTAECVTAECCATCVTAVPPVLLQSEGHKKVLALQDIKRLNAAIHLARYVAVALCGSKQQLRDLGSCTCQGCNLKEVGNMV